MKTLFLSALFCLSLALSATAQVPAAADKPAAQPSRRILTPEARKALLAKTGGFIQTKTEGPELLFLNAQSIVPASVIDDPVEQIGNALRLPAVRKDAPLNSEPIKAALAALQDKGIAAVVVVGVSAGYPSLLIAPESRWALVNVAALDGEGVTPEKLSDRTRKEVWRAFGYLMGAAHTSFEHCLLKTVLSPADLDVFSVTTLCPEPFNNILAHAQALGMRSSRMTTYRKAVEEGWAPAPTNDIQRAIWDELKK